MSGCEVVLLFVAVLKKLSFTRELQFADVTPELRGSLRLFDQLLQFLLLGLRKLVRIQLAQLCELDLRHVFLDGFALRLRLFVFIALRIFHLLRLAIFIGVSFGYLLFLFGEFFILFSYHFFVFFRYCFFIFGYFFFLILFNLNAFFDSVLTRLFVYFLIGNKRICSFYGLFLSCGNWFGQFCVLCFLHIALHCVEKVVIFVVVLVYACIFSLCGFWFYFLLFYLHELLLYVYSSYLFTHLLIFYFEIAVFFIFLFRFIFIWLYCLFFF